MKAKVKAKRPPPIQSPSEWRGLNKPRQFWAHMAVLFPPGPR